MSARVHRRVRSPMSVLTFCPYGLTTASFPDFAPLWGILMLGILRQSGSFR